MCWTAVVIDFGGLLAAYLRITQMLITQCSDVNELQSYSSFVLVSILRLIDPEPFRTLTKSAKA
jgi:hypothetical protein